MKISAKLVLTVSVASLIAIGSWHAYTNSQVPEHAQAFDVDAFEKARRISGPEKLNPQLINQISRVFADRSPSSAIPKEISNWNVALIDGIPYFPYWQDARQIYRFHPMAYGRFLSLIAGRPDVGFYLERLVSVAAKTPNGGYLWFYPNTYPLNRMIGKTLPSAIGQAQILGSLVDISATNHGQFAELARAAFRGISYDYYTGGVNLQDRVLLEIPLFESAPEIVLNGWLHSLILVNSYADWSNDAEAQELVRKNVEYPAVILSRYHDERTGLSRYSDLGPYKITISYDSSRVPELYAYYHSRSDELDDIVIPLKSIGYSQGSPYDNHIISRRDGSLQASVNCSQNYETYLMSALGAIEVSLRTGQYDPKRATPAGGGDEIALRSTERGKWNVVDLSSVRHRLFCGFPTNFAKGGVENYYHVYHIVALAYILATFELKEGEVNTLKRWMVTWYETVAKFAPSDHMYFADFDEVLNELATHHRRIKYEDWETLFHDAKSR